MDEKKLPEPTNAAPPPGEAPPDELSDPMGATIVEARNPLLDDLDGVDGKESAGQQTLYQLLKKDVSWKSIKDVLLYEIPTPGADRTAKDIADIALEQGWITADQLEELRQNKDLVGDSIGQALVEREIISAEQLQEAQEQKKRTGQPLYRTLMQLKMALPQDVVDVLSTPLSLPFGARPNTDYTQWLLDQKALSKEALDGAWKAAKAEKEDFRKHLLAKGLVTEEQHAQALAHELHLPYESLTDVVTIQPRLIKMLPAFILRRHKALPFKLEKDTLYIAFGEAHHVSELEKMGLLLDVEMQPVVAPPTRLQELLDAHVSEADEELALGDEESIDYDRAGSMAAVELLTVIVRGVIKSGGTDVHVEPQKDSARVRYRVDGMLHDVMTLDLNNSRKIVSRIKSLSNMDIANRHIPQDGHLVITVHDQVRNFRISTIPTIYGEKVAMRLVQSDMANSSFDHLGMTVEQRRMIDSILNLPNGLIVTTGPVGSGKTTTLYACLNALDCFTHNIVTIEDPVEYDIAGINQVQVNLKRKVSFAVGLRAILRQDPDVIMVGEIRDEETAEIAVRAAMTGSLVLSTIHANSATTCISSFIQLGVRPFMVSHAISAVIFQRLVRKVCTECREERPATAAEKKELGVAAHEELSLSKGKGCAHCLHTGYHGRTGVFEILKINDAYRQAIVDNPSLANLKRAAFDAEMYPLRRHACELVRAGVTTLDEMLRIL